jgi:Domain of unknown function (DUF6867)
MMEIYAAENWMQVLLVTVVIGGGAALMTGRAVAQTWRPYWSLIVYTLLLSAGVRFLHFALFSGYILSLPSYLVDVVFLLAVGSVTFRMTRTVQMTRQYPWLYERTGPFSWRDRQPEA